MRFIMINNERINISNIKKYYNDRPSISVTSYEYVAIEFIDGDISYYENMTVEKIDQLLGVNKSKPRPRG